MVWDKASWPSCRGMGQTGVTRTWNEIHHRSQLHGGSPRCWEAMMTGGMWRWCCLGP